MWDNPVVQRRDELRIDDSAAIEIGGFLEGVDSLLGRVSELAVGRPEPVTERAQSLLQEQHLWTARSFGERLVRKQDERQLRDHVLDSGNARGGSETSGGRHRSSEKHLSLCSKGAPKDGDPFSIRYPVFQVDKSAIPLATKKDDPASHTRFDQCGDRRDFAGLYGWDRQRQRDVRCSDPCRIIALPSGSPCLGGTGARHSQDTTHDEAGQPDGCVFCHLIHGSIPPKTAVDSSNRGGSQARTSYGGYLNNDQSSVLADVATVRYDASLTVNFGHAAKVSKTRWIRHGEALRGH
jgi:hypothetical protein